MPYFCALTFNNHNKLFSIYFLLPNFVWLFIIFKKKLLLPLTTLHLCSSSLSYSRALLCRYLSCAVPPSSSILLQRWMWPCSFGDSFIRYGAPLLLQHHLRKLLPCGLEFRSSISLLKWLLDPTLFNWYGISQNQFSSVRQESHVIAYRLLRLLNRSSVQTDVLGRWSAQEEKEIRMLSRPDGSRLFQNLTRGNWYLIQAEGYLNNSASGQTSEMALTWNRTALPGGSVSVY